MGIKHKLKNSKGLFSAASELGVLSEATINALEKHSATLSGAELQDCQVGIRALRALPLGEAFTEMTRIDGPEQKGTGHQHKYFGHGKILSRYWVSPDSFVNTSPSTGLTQSNPKDCGWDVIEGVLKALPAINRALAQADMGTINAYALRNAKGVMKKSADWIFDPVDPIRELMLCEAWAIHVETTHNGVPYAGYLDSKGNRAPLSRAKLYESEVAAIRSATAHGVLHESQIARVAMDVQSVMTPTGSSPAQSLRGALAQRESQRLSEFLSQVSIEELKKRVAELEALSGGPSETPVARKPRQGL